VAPVPGCSCRAGTGISPPVPAAVAGCPRRLRRRSLPVILEGQQQDDLAHQAGDDALLAITSKLDRFRRESRFAPWADKLVMLEVSAKLGRHYWRNPPVPMSGDA
jgi:RNA polymerase sigma-70 factor, ECF subfamily